MPLPDISKWYTPDRVAAEEEIWAAGQHYVENARRIGEICLSHHLCTVIEAGCGTGWIPTVLPSSLLYLMGIDANSHMLCIARRKSPSIRFVRADLRCVAAASPCADLVCCFAVLKHFSLAEWPGVLAAILSLGRFGLFNQHVLPEGRDSMDSGTEWHNIWPTYSDVVTAIESAGHEIIEWDDSHVDEGVGAPEVYITTRRTAA